MARDAHKKAIFSNTNVTATAQQPQFNRTLFDDAVIEHGYATTIERRLKCPCISEGTGHAMPQCVNCGGTGHFFIDKQECTLLVQSINNIVKYQQWSPTNAGTISVTSIPPNKVGFMDKITLLEVEMWHSQLCHLVLNNDGTKLFSFLVYNPITVFEVYLFKGSGTALQFLNEDQYQIVENKIIFNYNDPLFNDLDNPALTIRYTHNPSYYVIDINRDLMKQKSVAGCNINDENKRNYPTHSVARLAHYVLDEPNFDGQSLEDNTNYNRKPINYDL